MKLAKMISQLPESTAPIMKPIFSYGNSKVIAIGLKNGITLKEHIAPCTAKLVVIKGQVLFLTAETSISLSCYDEFDISQKVLHAVKAVEDSICLLILAK